MKKYIWIIFILTGVLIFLFLIMQPNFTGQAVVQEKIKLGYCLTMQEDAFSLYEKDNYELVKFGSAVEALSALKNNQIDKALIGRKAELNEVNSNVKERVLKSGYTLVSNKKGFISYSELPSIDVYTYLEEDSDFPVKRISKQETLNKINEGKIALISWEDWDDSFEIVIVMDGDEKVKEFRGAFLYEK